MSVKILAINPGSTSTKIAISDPATTKIAEIATGAHEKAMEEVKKAEEEAKKAESEEKTVQELIYEACSKYGVEYKLALAIATLETGHFKSDAYIYGNNPGGMSINEVPISYSTREEGVDAFVSNLVTYYEKGLTTPETIGSVYCPPNASNWCASVTKIMEGL